MIPKKVAPLDYPKARTIFLLCNWIEVSSFPSLIRKQCGNQGKKSHTSYPVTSVHFLTIPHPGCSLVWSLSLLKKKHEVRVSMDTLFVSNEQLRRSQQSESFRALSVHFLKLSQCRLFSMTSKSLEDHELQFIPHIA